MSRGRPPALPRIVIALGVVSLLTDMSTEMIYPLLPVFVAATLGGGPVAIGVIEGVAEATAAAVKLLSGPWSDRLRRRKPLVVTGYGLAGLVRPLVGFATSWPAVLFIRFSDRVGKGLRGPPRDALIADAVDTGARGHAFGFHQAMDHAGAVVGPLAAFALIGIGLGMRQVFFSAAVPAALVLVVLVLAVSEPPRSLGSGRDRAGAAPRRRWPIALADLPLLGSPFRRLLLALVVFTLGNSTDAFLLLRLRAAGFGVEILALLWSLHHVVKMTASYVGGRASDRFSRRALLTAGWLLYAAVYLAFAAVASPAGLVTVFIIYGLTFGVTEPVQKAWAADLVPASRRGAAFGWMQGAVGLASLPASLLFGAIWWAAGSAAAFASGAGLAMVGILLLLRVGGASEAVEAADPR